MIGDLRDMLDMARINLKQAKEFRLKGEEAKALPLEAEAEELIKILLGPSMVM